MRLEITLTKNDCDVLLQAAWLHRKHKAGIGPRRGGQFRQFGKLELHDLVVFTGFGRDIDAESIDGREDVPIYHLTEIGWLVVSQRERAICRQVDYGG